MYDVLVFPLNPPPFTFKLQTSWTSDHLVFLAAAAQKLLVCRRHVNEDKEGIRSKNKQQVVIFSPASKRPLSIITQ